MKAPSSQINETGEIKLYILIWCVCMYIYNSVKDSYTVSLISTPQDKMWRDQKRQLLGLGYLLIVCLSDLQSLYSGQEQPAQKT